jgi:hypothetical protein
MVRGISSPPTFKPILKYCKNLSMRVLNSLIGSEREGFMSFECNKCGRMYGVYPPNKCYVCGNTVFIELNRKVQPILCNEKGIYSGCTGV